eukprot:Filipodium_phascolosomae@DN1138_c0_g1_i2.p1
MAGELPPRHINVAICQTNVLQQHTGKMLYRKPRGHSIDNPQSISRSIYPMSDDFFFKPPFKTLTTTQTDYILRCLEPYNRNSNIQSPDVRRNILPSTGLPISGKHAYMHSHLLEHLDSKARETSGNIRDYSAPRFLVPKLWRTIVEMEYFRRKIIPAEELRAEGPLPYVKETLSVVPQLNASDVLWFRSNHRIHLRRHPRWQLLQYHKSNMEARRQSRVRIMRDELRVKKDRRRLAIASNMTIESVTGRKRRTKKK